MNSSLVIRHNEGGVLFFIIGSLSALREHQQRRKKPFIIFSASLAHKALQPMWQSGKLFGK
jgi:hypothetical protein